MAQIRGHYSETGSSTDFRPLEAIKDILGRFLLRTSNAGKPMHYNGTANTSPVDVNLGATTRHVLIQNLDNTNVLQVSFDGGTNYYTVQTLSTLELDAEVTGVRVLAAAAVNFEILTLE